MREQRTRKQYRRHTVGALPRPDRSARNAHRFFIVVEGVTEETGHVRGANGIRWKVA